MEPQTKSKLYKYYFLATGLFLLISFAVAVFQNADERNGTYHANGLIHMHYFSLDYSKNKVDVRSRWMCGNDTPGGTPLLAGKPQPQGNRIFVINPHNPSQAIVELTPTKNGFNMPYTDEEGNTTILEFSRVHEEFSMSGMLARMGFPSSYIP